MSKQDRPAKDAPEEKEVVSTKIHREEFIRTLEQMQPGLANRETVQQSSCFIFQDGMVMTYNEEVACRGPSGLPDTIRGAVPSAPLIDILRKLPDEFIRIKTGKNFTVHGKGRRTGIAMEGEIQLEISKVEQPGKWKPIHEDFTDAVKVVGECASKDQNDFTFTCVHIHPEYMEACDNTQLTRYWLETGVDKAFLVPRDSLKFVPAYDFTKFSVTERWVHFRTKDKMVMSCQKHDDPFESLDTMIEAKGIPTVLPKALGEAAQRCAVFSKENSDKDMVTVELKEGMMKLRGEGASGFHEEDKKLKYSGKPMKFRVAPNLLVELVKRHTDCEISNKKWLIVDGGKFRYCASLEEV